MPKPARTSKEVEQFKNQILEQAVNLMVEIGYEKFTMRNLAARVGITATTIYNYYRNKDDLFLNILILGFHELHSRLEVARRINATPAEQLLDMITTYIDFGLNDANFYNLMYTWHVPKFNDYVGTAMEPVARRQLECALKVPEIFIDTIKAYVRAAGKVITDDETVFLVIHYWSQIHGFIAGTNNTILSYLHANPVSLKEKHIALITEKFRTDVSRLENAGGKE